MDGRYKKLLSNTGILTISNFASKILVFLLVPLYTSILKTEEYGTYDLINTTMGLLLPLITVNIADGVMRFLMDDNSNDKAVISIGFTTCNLGLAATGGLLLINKSIGVVSFINGYELIFFVFFFFYVNNLLLTQIAKGLDNVKAMGIAGVLGTITTIVANILFLIVFKKGLIGFFIANILGSAIPVVYYVITLRIYEYFRVGNFDRDLFKRMALYSIPLIAVTLGWNINNSLDKYMVTAFCGLSANGLLAISYKIPTILSVLQSIFIQAWQISAISEIQKDDVKHFYKNTFNYICIFSTLTCGCLIILTRPLASFLYAKEFYAAWQFVPFLLISSVFNAAGGFVGPILSAKMDAKGLAKSSCYGVIINAICNYVLISNFGIQGAAIATAISSFVIYSARRYYAHDLLVVKGDGKIYFLWLCLICLAITEITIGNYMMELSLLLIIIIICYKDIARLYSRLMSIRRSK